MGLLILVVFLILNWIVFFSRELLLFFCFLFIVAFFSFFRFLILFILFIFFYLF